MSGHGRSRQTEAQCQPVYTVPAGFRPLPGWLIRDLLDASKYSEDLDTLRACYGLPTRQEAVRR